MLFFFLLQLLTQLLEKHCPSVHPMHLCLSHLPLVCWAFFKDALGLSVVCFICSFDQGSVFWSVWWFGCLFHCPSETKMFDFKQDAPASLYSPISSSISLLRIRWLTSSPSTFSSSPIIHNHHYLGHYPAPWHQVPVISTDVLLYTACEPPLHCDSRLKLWFRDELFEIY